MSGVIRSFRDTLVRGILWLVPVMLFGMLVAKAIGMLRQVVAPIAEPLGTLGGVSAPALVAVLLLVVVCLLAGLIARTRGALGITNWLERTVLTRIPGYSYVKGMGESMAGVEGATAYQPVLARIEDAWQLGIIVETIEPGQYAVFVPGAPNPWSGSVYFMAEDRVRKLEMTFGQMQGCLKRLGIGSGPLLRGHLR